MNISKRIEIEKELLPETKDECVDIIKNDIKNGQFTDLEDAFSKNRENIELLRKNSSIKKTYLLNIGFSIVLMGVFVWLISMIYASLPGLLLSIALLIPASHAFHESKVQTRKCTRYSNLLSIFDTFLAKETDYNKLYVVNNEIEANKQVKDYFLNLEFIRAIDFSVVCEIKEERLLHEKMEKETERFNSLKSM